MAIERKDVEKLALLARISLSDTEKEKMAGEIDSILGYVSQIKEAAGKSEEKGVGIVRNVFREDVDPHDSGIYTEKLLADAPKREGEYVAVKKIL